MIDLTDWDCMNCGGQLRLEVETDAHGHLDIALCIDCGARELV